MAHAGYPLQSFSPQGTMYSFGASGPMQQPQRHFDAPMQQPQPNWQFDKSAPRDPLLQYFVDKDLSQQREQESNEQAKAVALKEILSTGKATYAHIQFYNCIAAADSLQAGVEEALSAQKDMFDGLINFNALLAGFTFIGLPIGQPPETNLQVAAYAALILGFFFNIIGALLGFIATLHISGLLKEEWPCVRDNFFNWSTKFFFCNYLSILGVGSLTVGINIILHDLFTDNTEFLCFRRRDDWTCGPPSIAFAIIPNVLTVLGFFILCWLLVGSVFRRQAGRKMFQQEAVN